MTRWEEKGWQEEDLNKLCLSFFNEIFELKDSSGVDVTIEFARYLNKVGVHPDNYPIFLKLIGMRNHWIVDALLGENDLEDIFNLVQPNYFILKECFQSITRVQRGGIYEKSLIVILSIINRTYKNSIEGYRIYDLKNEDLNNLGKHLDDTQDQRFPLNMKILNILDNIASLVDPAQNEVDLKLNAIAIHANNIRGKFLDMNKSLDEAIPENLLIPGDFNKDEVPPTTK
ncbi:MULTISPECIES: hypothetical protein [unclassified Oceanispirochaeta]|uniref:hypothetical protein n=1 Tax=unclassified Oceanispirochaeta TaxID=2635722 RepID=UPI000E09D014|nr:MULTISPECIES: hypothetical protein [unclassified Oceanispirochaeta]MBF9018974.1 hypothetical protein [Oceanispirochaeta sp. M2]NPD75474.1 hypothetical protein [Oceanispirochaeta sp. M1]RDG28666.1 hypothetical protein DV872_25600 [Oceanispirochaeta sp. M1]